MSAVEEAGRKAGQTELLRDFTATSAFSLAFAFISPIVALYSIFTVGLTMVGPGFWWGFPITLAGQMLVALSFAMLVSRLPLEGSIYQWSRHLLGPTYGWFAGWAYIWTLPIAIAAVSLGGAGFLAQFLGLDSTSKPVTITLALALIAGITLANTIGRKFLKVIIGLCIVAEIIGSIGLGVVFLGLYQVNDISVLSEGVIDPTTGGFMLPPLLFGVAIAGWAFVGFESAGSIAEEVKDPQRAVPKAMIYSLLFVSTIVAFSALAVILAIPDLAAVRAGSVADPVAATIEHHLGPVGLHFMTATFVIGFIACMVGLQASVSRVIWALAREGDLPFAKTLAKLSGEDRLPVNAILAAAVMSLVFFALSFTNIYMMLLTFTTAGFYISFLFPALAAAYERITQGAKPSSFNLGKWSGVVTIAAAVWLIFQTANISWPRFAELPWYENWAVLLVVSILAVLGFIVRAFLPKR